MPRYAISNLLGGTQQAVGATYKTIASVHTLTAGLRRLRIKEILVSFDGSPANNVITVDVSRTTVPGTATAATPVPLNPADSAAQAIGNINHTVEPTVTAGTSLLNVALNQQATLRWVADQDSDLIVPATNNAGIAVRVRSASYTGTAVVEIIYEE